MALVAGDADDAHMALAESILTARRMGDRRAAWTLDVAACVAAGAGQFERALSLAAAGGQMHRTDGVRPPASWPRALAAWLDPARRGLDRETIVAAEAAGAALSFEGALELALEGSSTVAG
jgi:hypothetical protein